MINTIASGSFQALIFGRQHKKDKQRRRREHQDRRCPLLFLLERDLRALEDDPRRQHPLSEFLHPLQRGSGRNCGGRDPLNLGREIQVVARHAKREGSILQPGDFADWHHLARGVARAKRGQVTLIAPEAAVRLRDHLVSPTQQVEVV